MGKQENKTVSLHPMCQARIVSDLSMFQTHPSCNAIAFTVVAD